MMRSGDAHAQAMIASAEFAPRFGANASSLVLDGSRLDRLNLLSAKLSAMQGEVLLRLDGTDEYLLDIAAADAGLAVRRGAQISDGTRALITPINRKIA